jgi:hypothetical protein
MRAVGCFETLITSYQGSKFIVPFMRASVLTPYSQGEFYQRFVWTHWKQLPWTIIKRRFSLLVFWGQSVRISAVTLLLADIYRGLLQSLQADIEILGYACLQFLPNSSVAPPLDADTHRAQSKQHAQRTLSRPNRQHPRIPHVMGLTSALRCPYTRWAIPRNGLIDVFLFLSVTDVQSLHCRLYISL